MTANANLLGSRPKPGDDVVGRDFDRELLVFQAQMCEQAGRFEDMVSTMNGICNTYGDLSEEERNLLSCAYKNVIGSRRTSWRIVSENLQQLEAGDADDKMLAGGNNTSLASQHTTANGNRAVQESRKFDAILVQSFLKTIELELRLHCGNIIDILASRLIPSVANTGESRVFYYKMKGDYMRYLCEISQASERKEKANESLLAYKAACDKAMIDLPPTHPVRLGLMLNFSVFYYDIMKSPERSCRLAKQAFDDAIAELDTLSEESYRDSTIIMQLLRDNLNLWESEQSIQSEQ